MTVGEFKTHFSEVVAYVKAGEQIAVTYGKKKELLGYFQPNNPVNQLPKRKLGILQGKASAVFMDDWEMTEEEFLGL